ncbi:beta-lactamase/transpeptidase-like protein [Hyaloscypha variabilis]
MDSLEGELREETGKNNLPGTMLAAANLDGTFNYESYFGKASLKPDAKPVSGATTFCIASATKLATSVAAMQCIERGLIELYDDVTAILPELKDIQIFTGIEDGKPVMKKAQNKITLSHLLSHTSGLASIEDEEIMGYYQAIGDPKGTLLMRYFVTEDEEVRAKALPEVQHAMENLSLEPLLFEPGTAWNYGQSTDWAGQLIERLTHQSLESYCQANIFGPLSMKSTTFRPADHPHVLENLMPMAWRNQDGTIKNEASIYPLAPNVELGGSGLYTCAPDYLAFLTSLLRNDGKVLKPETVDLMFNYRIPDESIMKSEKVKGFFDWGAHPDDVGTEYDHCLCGLVNLKDMKTGKKAGSVRWGGGTKSFWWIDRAGGVCGFYGTQILGMAEKLSGEMYRKFQIAVYDQVDATK